MQQLYSECRQELTEHILPFWMALRDARGGFYGQMTRDLTVHKDAPKGTILHARILWSFSRAYLDLKKPEYLDAAKHAYEFLRKAWDTENGGFYWSLTADGAPDQTDKYAYANAFCIYGLMLYYDAAGDKAARTLAMDTFHCIESHFAEPNGYIETFTREWGTLENDHLSEHDLHAAKTMNTTLHLIEAYTELYRITKDRAVRTALRNLLLLTADTIYDAENKMLRVFFDENMQVLGDLHSYGHDIEASWLIDRACDCLGDHTLTIRFRAINHALAQHVYDAAFHDGALYNERFMQNIDKTRIWWVQAEAVIGFLNAAETAEALYEEPEDAEKFRAAAKQIWQYIKEYQIDRREGGEWYAETDLNGQPQSDFDMAGPWKCPYHNSRMCMEVMRRLR